MKLLKLSLALCCSVAFFAAGALEVTAESDLRGAVAAAEILRAELKGIPGGENARIVLKYDAGMKREEFSLTGDGKQVTMTSGKYGFVPAAAYYLDKLCNIIRFSHFERDTENAQVALKFAPVRKNPVFNVRDIHFTSEKDRGRLSALRGMNAHGDYTAEFAENNGMPLRYGGPKFCHTFHLYIPAKKYFKDHPEWFAEVNGKRIATGLRGTRKSQLCVSNHELREYFAKKLLDRIAEDRAKAAEQKLDPPDIYDVSQNDVNGYCTCKECNALIKKYGAPSGALLEFVNYIAGKVAKKYPEIWITTFAYQYSEVPPTGIVPASNVVVVLTDSKSNVIFPVSHPENEIPRRQIERWSKIAKHLRIWDYHVYYREPNELPYNSEDTFAEDFRFYRNHNVLQYFTEFEYPHYSDVRDYKLFLLTELINDPDADVEAAKKRFCKAYYGAAWELFLQYRNVLRESQYRNRSAVDWMTTAPMMTHLDYPTVKASHDIFEKGEKLLANDPVRLRRWRFARLGLDRATIELARQLKTYYYRTNGNSLAGYPWTNEELQKRIDAVVAIEFPARLTERQLAREKRASRFVRSRRDASTTCRNAPTDEKVLGELAEFKGVDKADIWEYTLFDARTHRSGTFVDDPEAISGKVLKIDVTPKMKNWHLPITFGVYSRAQVETLKQLRITMADFAPGKYKWYKLGSSKLAGNVMTLYCTRSWGIQFDICGLFDHQRPDAEFTFYLRAKFTGKQFGGNETDPNTVWLDRLVIVREKENKNPEKK